MRLFPVLSLCLLLAFAASGHGLTKPGSGGGGIASVVADTTPQLGGDLDTQGNDIGQLNTVLNITDAGNGTVTIDADAVELLSMTGLTGDVILGDQTGETTIDSDLTVNGTATADAFISTASDGTRGANFTDNTTTYSCSASGNEFDIYADSSGTQDGLPLWCDGSAAVHEFVSTDIDADAHVQLVNETLADMVLELIAATAQQGAYLSAKTIGDVELASIDKDGGVLADSLTAHNVTVDGDTYVSWSVGASGAAKFANNMFYDEVDRELGRIRPLTAGTRAGSNLETDMDFQVVKNGDGTGNDLNSAFVIESEGDFRFYDLDSTNTYNFSVPDISTDESYEFRHKKMTTVSATPHTAIVGELRNGTYFVTVAAEIDLPAADAGMYFCVYSDSANAVSVDPEANDQISLPGDAPLTAGNKITSASARGDAVCLEAVSDSRWIVTPGTEVGAWTDGGGA